MSSPIPVELLVPARPTQLPQAGCGNCLAGCDNGCPCLLNLVSDLSAPSSLSLPPLSLTLSSQPHNHFLLYLSSQPQQSGFGNGEACQENRQEDPAGDSLLLISGPSSWALSLWQRLHQERLDQPGLMVGPSRQMRGWAGARGGGQSSVQVLGWDPEHSGEPGHVVKTGWDKKSEVMEWSWGSRPHLCFRVVSRLPLTEAGTSVLMPRSTDLTCLVRFLPMDWEFPKRAAVFPTRHLIRSTLGVRSVLTEHLPVRGPGLLESRQGARVLLRHPEWLTEPVLGPQCASYQARPPWAHSAG